MYIVKTTVTRLPFYNDQVFLMYVAREESGFQPLRKKEAKVLLEIFSNYPKLFKDPYIMVWDRRQLELTNTSAAERYECSMTCDLEYLMEDISLEDKQKLLSIPGRIQGFAEKFMEGESRVYAPLYSLQA